MAFGVTDLVILDLCTFFSVQYQRRSSPFLSLVAIPLKIHNIFHIKIRLRFFGLTWICFSSPRYPTTSASRDNLPGISWKRSAQREQQLTRGHSQHQQVVPHRPPDSQNTRPPSTRGSVTWCLCSETSGSRPTYSQHLSKWSRVRMNTKNSCFVSIYSNSQEP